ncbi:PDZ domain-containing protein [Planctomycetota bacterium]|nr:PDZ domain-containing protein [Planctomycetota bacterium]
MHKSILPFSLLLLLALTSLTTAQSAPVAPVDTFADYVKLQARVQAIAKKVRPAVVGVRMSRSSGSGCFISADGWVATAGHVTGTKPGTTCRIVMHGGKMLDAVTYGWHEQMDYGLIKADTKGVAVPFCKLGKSEDVVAGQWLVPMGHPLGPETGRDAVVRAGRCLLPENPRSMITMDAPVISGDSGGPVFDLKGEIIAINQSIQTNNVSINNVTPVKLYKEILNELKANKTWGNGGNPQWGSGLKQAAEGVPTGQDAKDYQAAINAYRAKKYKKSANLFDKVLADPKRPAGVFYNGACTYALYAKQLKGDAKEAMALKAVAAFRQSIENGWRDMDHAGSDADLDSLRDRDDFQEVMDYGRKAGMAPVLGLSVRSARGIRVDQVLPNSKAAKAGFTGGDIIEKVGKEKIQKATHWVKAVIETGLTEATPVKVKSSGKRKEIVVTVPPFGAKIFGQGGAKIVSLVQGGLAFNAGLKEKDVIVRVGETKIKSALDFANAMMLSDGNEEIDLEVRRGYAREVIKFSYSTGDEAIDDSGVLAREDWKQGENLLTLWEGKLGEQSKGSVFPVKQKGKQVAFATAISADGLLLTKASQIESGTDFVLLDGTKEFEAEIVARSDRYDVAMLKAKRSFKTFLEFKEKATEGFPEIGTMLASVDDDGKIFAHGFVALPPYDTDKIAGRPDPNSPFLGINARNAEDGGAEVTSVSAGMPAAKGGLEVGDVIVAMDGQEVKDWTSLIAMIKGRGNTETVTLTVKRGEKTEELSVTLVPRAKALGGSAPSKGTGKPELGIFGCRKHKEGGIEIGIVKSGTPAELAGINSGEQLLKIDGKELTKQRELDDAIKAREIGDKVTLTLLRDGAEVEIEIELSEQDAPPPPPGGGRPNVKGPINDRYTHFGKVVQHDGVTLPNQQGSPVFDLQGNLIGLNIARADRTRTFALPTERIVEILKELASKKH